MLKSDGLGREQFLPLWRDAMWSSLAIDERARLTLELGRVELRESRKGSPLLVAVVEQLDTPLVLLQLDDAPSVSGDQRQREILRTRLAELGTSEAYTMVSLIAGRHGGTPNYLLAVWGEALDGRQSCWMMPYRFTPDGVEEAAPMQAPDPDSTVLARELAGLLTHRH